VAAGSSWASPLGNLYITFSALVTREYALKNAYHLPQVTSAAVVKALMDFEVDKRAKL